MNENSDSYEVKVKIKREALLQGVQDYFVGKLAEQHHLEKGYIGAIIDKDRLSKYFDKNIKRFAGKKFDYNEAIKGLTAKLMEDPGDYLLAEGKSRLLRLYDVGLRDVRKLGKGRRSKSYAGDVKALDDRVGDALKEFRYLIDDFGKLRAKGKGYEGMITPEMELSLGKLEQLGFGYEAISTLQYEKRISAREAKKLREAMVEPLNREYSSVKGEHEKIFSKLAAHGATAVLLALGLTLVTLSSANITGITSFAIADNGVNPAYPMGIGILLLIIVAGALIIKSKGIFSKKVKPAKKKIKRKKKR